MHLPEPLIDAHTHFFYDRSYYESLFEERDLRVAVINITGHGLLEDFMQERWEAMVKLKEQYPSRFILCTSFEPAHVQEEDFAERVIEKLAGEIRQGASFVKVWKDIGLMVRDEDGSFVQIDDERFRPIWDFLAEERVPVLAHIAEPRAAWQPLDRQGPHYQYYEAHPQHHLHGRSDIPSWETLIAARDRWIEENPELTIIGAHFGSMAHDVREVAHRFERYPNFYVDTSERFGDLVIQPSKRVRTFFERYSDRIIYGTDFLLKDPKKEEKGERKAYEALLADHWNYLSGVGEIEVQNKFVKPVKTTALGLSEAVLNKIYHETAKGLFGVERVGA